jgi:hypothetical protein
MQNEKTIKMAEEALSRLSSELEAGHSEGLKSYLSVMGRFHRYSWNNVLLIHSQRPTANHVAGLHAWNDLGRTVNKGEKAIAILAPVMAKARETPSPQDAEAKEPFRVVGFRTVCVFDISQTSGKPLPAFSETRGDPTDFADRLKALVAQRGIAVEYDPTIAPAQGISTGGRIRLQPGLSPAEEFSVLAHELAHEMMHHRKDGPRPPEVIRETQAEAVAYVVCRAAGLETNHAAADYIALYRGDKKTLAESLAVIQETSAKILDELMPRERPSPEKANSLSADRESSVQHAAAARALDSQAEPAVSRAAEMVQDSPQFER